MLPVQPATLTDCVPPLLQAGKRLCLGKNVALLEAVMVLAKLYSKWSFKLQPGRHVTYALSVTLPVKDGLFVTAHPRTSS